MAYTTNQLISDAYYASGIVSRDFQTVSGTQVNEGLRWLNEIISTKIIEPDVIPYETKYEFNTVIGQEKYAIPDLIYIDTITFDYQSVRYPMRFMPRDEYFGAGRVNTIESLPCTYYYEKTLTGADLYIYFLPNKVYPFTIYGIFRLSPVALGENLEDTLNLFYITYLKYSLAKKICDEYGMASPMGVVEELSKYQKLISKQSRPLDMSMRKDSTLGSEDRFGWAWVNLGRGFLPGNY